MSSGKSIDFLFNQMRNAGSGSLAGGTITFYSAGTTSLATVYLDRNMAVANIAANPYTLSADGTASLFAIGLFRVVVKNSSGVTVYDYDNVEFSTATSESTGSITTTGDCLTEEQTITLSIVYNQYVMRTGISTFPLTIILPGGYTFADGSTTYTLTADSEVLQFLLNGSEFVVI